LIQKLNCSYYTKIKQEDEKLSEHDVENQIQQNDIKIPIKQEIENMPKNISQLLLKYFNKLRLNKWFLFYGYFAMLITQAILNMILYILLNAVGTNLENFTNIFLAIVVIQYIIPTFWYIIDRPISNEVKICISNMFYSDELDRYNKQTFSNKHKLDIYEINKKLENIVNMIQNMIVTGMTNIINLVCLMIGTIYICIKQNMLMLFVITLIVNILYQLIIMCTLRKNMEKNRKIDNNEIHNYETKLTLFLPLIQYDNTITDTIKKIINYVLYKREILYYNNWTTLYFINKIINRSPYLLLYLMIHKYDIVTILIMMNVFDNLNNTFNTLINFLTGCEEYQDKLTIYKKGYDDLREQVVNICEECKKTIENNKRKIKIVNDDLSPLERNDSNYLDNKFCIENNNDIINLNFGETIVIRGESGIGKSTFINKLLGKINDDNVTIKFQTNKLDCDKNRDCFFEFYQSIKEKMPSGNITIKDLFKCYIIDEQFKFSYCSCINNNSSNEINNTKNKFICSNCKTIYDDHVDNDDELITECLKICELEKWYEKTMEKKLYQNISNKISGGEKSRLALATVIYKIITTGNKKYRVLILDEPEQGLDREIAKKVLKNIFDLCKNNGDEKYPEITKKIQFTNPTSVIMVTHLCDCVLNNIGATKKYRIVDE
jgi:ABC-type bacteriocin/lantibiotic exporter with double-glycine peptidase domain